MDLTQNYVSNMASTLPLDALRIAVWPHVWFEEIHLSGLSYRVVDFLPFTPWPVGNWTLRKSLVQVGVESESLPSFRY